MGLKGAYPFKKNTNPLSFEGEWLKGFEIDTHAKITQNYQWFSIIPPHSLLTIGQEAPKEHLKI
jgi:hypothetical protein